MKFGTCSARPDDGATYHCTHPGSPGSEVCCRCGDLFSVSEDADQHGEYLPTADSAPSAVEALRGRRVTVEVLKSDYQAKTYALCVDESRVAGPKAGPWKVERRFSVPGSALADALLLPKRKDPP